MLLSSLRSLAFDWGVQLCAEVTGNVCRHSVHIISMEVTSIPCHNNVLCWSLIPNRTESSVVWTSLVLSSHPFLQSRYLP
jgi:hypothetical protein